MSLWTCFRWEQLGGRGFTVSVTFGPCGTKGPAYSVNVLAPDGQTFDKPYQAKSFDDAILIAEKEIRKRGWGK